MNRALGAALLVFGVVLLIMAYSASTSFANDVSRFFTGDFTDKTMWMLLGGGAAAIGGIVVMSMPGRPLTS